MRKNDTYIAFMMDHAAGNHPVSFALAADMHVSLSALGAETASVWSMIGGVLLEDAQDEHRDMKAAVRAPRRAAVPDITAGDLLQKAETDLHWRRGISGVHYASSGVLGTKFMKLEPGESAPMHGHGGLEATVVLSGRFSDGHGTYARGDLVLGEPGLRHKPAAVGDSCCVCFVAHRPNRFWRYFQ